MCNCEDRPCCGHHLEEDPYGTDYLMPPDPYDDDPELNRSRRRKRRRDFDEWVDAFESGRF